MSVLCVQFSSGFWAFALRAPCLYGKPLLAELSAQPFLQSLTPWVTLPWSIFSLTHHGGLLHSALQVFSLALTIAHKLCYFISSGLLQKWTINWGDWKQLSRFRKSEDKNEGARRVSFFCRLWDNIHPSSSCLPVTAAAWSSLWIKFLSLPSPPPLSHRIFLVSPSLSIQIPLFWEGHLAVSGWRLTLSQHGLS